jgi:integrase
VKVLSQAPQPKALDLEDVNDVEEDLVTTWTEDELNRLYRALGKDLLLQTAFVLTTAAAGPRSVDLFTFRWDKHMRLEEDPPMLRFRAKKSGKKHGIPLPPVVITHLRRLQREHLFEAAGAVFPTLSSLKCKDPEKSHAARRRNRMMKKFMATAGVPDHERPWQVCRATCCTRLNNANPRAAVGSWVIGQGQMMAGTKLAEDHYYNPSELVIATIMSAPQPEAFLALR